jgi:hypothetical protein
MALEELGKKLAPLGEIRRHAEKEPPPHRTIKSA